MHVFNEQEAAPYCGVSVSYLRQSRTRHSDIEGPPYLKIGRAVRYRQADLDAWLESHLVRPELSAAEVF